MSKTILITGAAVRIGREIAITLAKAGHNIVVHYNTSAKPAQALVSELKSLGVQAWSLQADLMDSAAVANIFPQLIAQGIAVDALVNNASVFERNSLAEMNDKNWQKHMQVNCYAPLQLIRDLSSQYKGDSGCVINITDGMTGWSMSPTFFSYAMSKKALAGATELLARSLAPRIRINAVAPGPMLEGAQDKASTFETLRSVLPLKRTGTPQEVARAVQFLLESPMMTGQTLHLSGGVHLPADWKPTA